MNEHEQVLIKPMKLWDAKSLPRTEILVDAMYVRACRSFDATSIQSEYYIQRWDRCQCETADDVL